MAFTATGASVTPSLRAITAGVSTSAASSFLGLSAGDFFTTFFSCFGTACRCTFVLRPARRFFFCPGGGISAGWATGSASTAPVFADSSETRRTAGSCFDCRLRRGRISIGPGCGSTISSSSTDSSSSSLGSASVASSEVESPNRPLAKRAFHRCWLDSSCSPGPTIMLSPITWHRILKYLKFIDIPGGSITHTLWRSALRSTFGSRGIICFLRNVSLKAYRTIA